MAPRQGGGNSAGAPGDLRAGDGVEVTAARGDLAAIAEAGPLVFACPDPACEHGAQLDPASRRWRCQSCGKVGGLEELEPDLRRGLERRLPKPPRFRSEELREFLARPIPPRAWIVEGLLQERDALMVHAWRGVGKTRLAHGLAVAIASSGAFLRWKVPEPRGVLLVDGELPAAELQRMLAEAVLGAEAEVAAPLRILAADMQDQPLPRLATAAGQAAVEEHLAAGVVEVLVLDSISTLGLDAGRSNDPEAWDGAQTWLLRLRRRGVTTMLLHHDGKGHDQRGTSRREDVLSQVVQLTRPSDYKPSDGCRFEAHFRKARSVYGSAAEALEAKMEVNGNGACVWSWRPLEAAVKDRVLDLYRVGVRTQRELAAELQVGLGTVNRKLQELRAEGLIE